LFFSSNTATTGGAAPLAHCWVFQFIVVFRLDIWNLSQCGKKLGTTCALPIWLFKSCRFSTVMRSLGLASVSHETA
jgi:hypothetical protein